MFPAAAIRPICYAIKYDVVDDCSLVEVSCSNSNEVTWQMYVVFNSNTQGKTMNLRR